MTQSQQPHPGVWMSGSRPSTPTPGGMEEVDRTQEMPMVPASVAFPQQNPSWTGTTVTEVTQIAWVYAPMGILYGSLVASFLGIVLAAVGSNLALGVVSWLLSALVGLGLVGVFVRKDSTRQANPFYAHSPGRVRLYRVSVLLAFLGIVAAAVRIAFVVGRM